MTNYLNQGAFTLKDSIDLSNYPSEYISDNALIHTLHRKRGKNHSLYNNSLNGNSLLRHISTGSTAASSKMDNYYSPRYVPQGFAAYRQSTINPSDYNFIYMAGWRVAIHKSFNAQAASDLYMQISKYGPQSAGYARIGDTLVPASLSSSDRKALESF